MTRMFGLPNNHTMADRLRAEWFWTDRWMGSSAFLLPMEARGLYREMLTQAWTRGARLPASYEAIRRATGCTIEEWDRSWPEIKKYWREDGAHLVNDTQLEIYSKAMGISEKRSALGKKGAEARANAIAKPQANALANTPANASANVKHPSPSPSPSLNPYPEERKNGPCDHAFARKRFSETGRTTVCGCGEEFRSATANPFVPDRAAREALEREALRLVGSIAEITHEDGAAIFAEAAHYEGAKRQKFNPATMSDDRLLATVNDLKATLKGLQAKEPRRPMRSA